MPASWETVRRRRERILVAVLTPPDHKVTIAWAAALANLNKRLPPESNKMEVRGLPYDAARNTAAKAALDQGYNLFFLDSDVIVQADAVEKLWSTGLELVSGMYCQRFFPYQPAFFNERKNEKGELDRQPILGWQPGQLVPATFVPTGLLLIRHSLLQRVFAVHPRPFRWGVDVAPVPDYNGATVPTFSEDYTFSWLCKTQLGVQAYVHTGVYGLHEVQAVIGPRWVLPTASPEPTHGVVGVL